MSFGSPSPPPRPDLVAPPAPVEPTIAEATTPIAAAAGGGTQASFLARVAGSAARRAAASRRPSTRFSPFGGSSANTGKASLLGN